MVEHRTNGNEGMRNFFMEYKVIDRNSWHRKEYFEHYPKEELCTYSITTKLDITD